MSKRIAVGGPTGSAIVVDEDRKSIPRRQSPSTHTRGGVDGLSTLPEPRTSPSRCESEVVL
jgi:hypothetical protein